MIQNNKIYYKCGYKYQLAKAYSIQTDLYVAIDIDVYWIKLDQAGLLKIRSGYAWDGPSGPTIDTKSFMRGSLAHDAVYQLMRNGFTMSRKKADKLLYKICREDGMNRLRAWWVYRSVRMFGGYAAKTDNKREMVEAP